MEVFVSLDDQLKQSDHGTNKTVGNHWEPLEAMVTNAFQIFPKNSCQLKRSLQKPIFNCHKILAPRFTNKVHTFYSKKKLPNWFKKADLAKALITHRMKAVHMVELWKTLYVSGPHGTSKKQKNGRDYLSYQKNWRKKCVNLDDMILRQKCVNHPNVMNFVTK